MTSESVVDSRDIAEQCAAVVGALFTYADSTPLEPTFMFHEMGHAMGLDHSFDEQTAPCLSGCNRPGAYCDIFDLMSAANVVTFVTFTGAAVLGHATSSNVKAGMRGERVVDDEVAPLPGPLTQRRGRSGTLGVEPP
jgi:hypothetical protein